MRERLTSRQRLLLESITRFIKDRGYSPSQKELAKALDCDYTTVREILVPLERKGYVARARGIARSLRVLPARRNGNSKTADAA